MIDLAPKVLRLSWRGILRAIWPRPAAYEANLHGVLCERPLLGTRDESNWRTLRQERVTVSAIELENMQ